MKLYFCKTEGVRLIAEVETEDEAWQEINKFCKDRNYTIPYVRTWIAENKKHFDVGCWSQKFILELEDESNG